MKKIASIMVLPLFLIVFSCENPITNLPETDIHQYISGNIISFPKGTKAIDIYNTVKSLYPDNEYHDVIGNWKYIKTANSDDLINQTWETVSFTKIKHTHITHESGVNTHTVYLYSNDSSIKNIIFEWQRQTTNIWKNNILEGDVTFTF
jgi:hypothetical protein